MNAPAHKVFNQAFFVATVDVAKVHLKSIMGTKGLNGSLAPVNLGGFAGVKL